MNKFKLITTCISFFICILSGVAMAGNTQDNLLSFEFKGLSISEVLNKVENASGIEILINGDMEAQSVTKTYKNSSIDSIVLDIFNGENHAVLFQYDENGLAAINIWVLPEGNSRALRSNNLNKADVFLPVENNKTTREDRNRVRRSNYRSVRLTNKKKNMTAALNNSRYSSAYINKTDSPLSGNILEVGGAASGTSEALPSSDTFEPVDNIPAPEIASTLGLEPPPMPPGISF